VLSFFQFVPSLVLAPWAGALADRVDRRRLLLVTQLAAAASSAALAGFAWAGLATEAVVIGFAAALGVALALSQPAQMALVPSLVADEDVAQAVALNSATFNVARALGPTAAAAIVAWQGVAVAFVVNACSYLPLVAALAVIRPAEQERAERARLRDGIALLRASPSLLLYLLVVAAVSFGADPINTESPAIAHAFGRSSNWAGTVVGAFGVGAVVAAFAVAGRIRGSSRTMTATLPTMALGMVAAAASPWLPLAWGFLAVGGAGYLLSNTSATTRLQLGVAPRERGRIMALWSIAFLGTRPLASLIDGSLAGAFGVRVATAVLAGPALAGAVAAAALARRRVVAS